MVNMTTTFAASLLSNWLNQIMKKFNPVPEKIRPATNCISHLHVHATKGGSLRSEWNRPAIKETILTPELHQRHIYTETDNYTITVV